jgi:prepilin-type N-terminal cleavage/methylation domain-containing protein
MVGRRPTEQGLTLVELMVTMVIASIVAASTFMFFAGQQRVYETQTKLLNVQQNAWASMEVLSRFVRSEGSGMYGCVRQVGGLTPAAPCPTPLCRTPLVAVDDSDDPPVAVNPVIHNLSRAPNAGLRANVAVGRIPPLWIVDQEDGTDAGIVPGTDVITVAFGNRASGTNFDSLLAATVDTTVKPITTPAGFSVMFQTGEYILLVGTPSIVAGTASDIGCTLFQITSVGVSNTLTCASDASAICTPGVTTCTGSRWNPSGVVPAMIPAAYVPSANTGIRNFGELWWVRFAVRSTDPNNPLVIPTLTMERLDGSSPTGPQVLAEGIEDLQVAFACDLDGDGKLADGIPSKTADEWTLNDPNDPIPLTNAAKCNQPTAIRLTLIARSLTEDNGIDAALTNNRRPAAENHAAGAPDQFRRRVMTTTIYPRNN